MSHCLSIDPKMKPIKQRRRNFMQERNLAIAEEVDMLLQAGFIKEVSKDRSPTPHQQA
jgi:hypothetical protein